MSSWTRLNLEGYKSRHQSVSQLSQYFEWQVKSVSRKRLLNSITNAHVNFKAWYYSGFFFKCVPIIFKKDTLVLIHYAQVQNIKTEYNEISKVVTH